MQEFATFVQGGGPVVAVALHAGHELRPGLANLTSLTEADRLREEDPFTADWTACAHSRVVVNRSRFEVDCNRPRERAVYRVPDDAWDLPLWGDVLPQSEVDASLALYDAFYARLDAVFSEAVDKHGAMLVLDLHAYNHRREGSGAPPALRAENPDVNLGTGYLDRDRWGGVADTFIREFRSAMPETDVRENVRFRGGHLARWAADAFGGAVCVLAIEFKKTYMDEWTGEVDPLACGAIADALGDVVPALESALLRSV